MKSPQKNIELMQKPNNVVDPVTNLADIQWHNNFCSVLEFTIDSTCADLTVINI